MEAIGKVNTQEYLSICPKCGTVFVFDEMDLNPLDASDAYSEVQHATCPGCDSRTPVLRCTISFLFEVPKLKPLRPTKKISLKKYTKLKAKFGKPHTNKPLPPGIDWSAVDKAYDKLR